MHSFYNILLFLLVASCSFMVVEALKCHTEMGSVLAPNCVTEDKHECKIYYMENSPTELGCYRNSKDKYPSEYDFESNMVVNETVNGDHLKCYKEPAGLGYKCFCGTNLCNAINSPLHDRIFEYIQTPTRNKHFECITGKVQLDRAPLTSDTRPAIYDCKNHIPKDTDGKQAPLEKRCGIVYKAKRGMIPRFEYSCTNNFVQFKNQENLNHTRIPGDGDMCCVFDRVKLDEIQCSCDTYGCNAVGSTFQKRVLEFVQSQTGNDYSGIFTTTVQPPTTTTTTTEKPAKITEAIVQSPESPSEPPKDQPDNQDNQNTEPNSTPSEGANKSDEQKDEETTTKGSGSYKTALSMIIFVFCVVVSRDRHFM